MRTKKLFICLLLLSIVKIIAQEWKLQYTPTAEALFDVFFIDKMKGWVVGNNGIVLRTTDSGKTWLQQESGTMVNLRSVFFVDSLNGYSVGSGGRIIKSTDGGKTWAIQSSGTNLYLSNVFFINTKIGWAVGGELFNGTILKTTDSGLIWKKMIDSTAGSFRAVHFINEKVGWVVGARSLFDNFEPHRILHTTDGGITWQNLSDFTRPGPLVDVHFLNQKSGWVSGFSPNARGILYTNNGGLTWTDIRIQRGELSWSDYYRSLAVVDSNNIWVATNDTIYRTINGGIFWNATRIQSAKGLCSIYFFDNHNGWAVGVEGSIWKYDDNIVSIHSEKRVKNKSILEDCYPNPANPIAHIKYYLEKESYINLILYNLLGQEVVTLVKEYKLPGYHETIFDGSKLPSGVYFYSIILDSNFESKKLLLIK